MLPVILLALLFAKIKKLKLSVLLKAYALFPFFCVEIVYWCFQISIFSGNYATIAYSNYVKSAFLYLMLIPIIMYRLYKPALVGSLFILTGTGLNKLVIHANGGYMPVYPTVSKWIGYVNEGVVGKGSDTLHCMGTQATRLKFLTDYIDIGFSVLSVGDLFIRSFVFIILYFTIKALNERQQAVLA